MENLANYLKIKKNIHFIGIGGISMSALAQILSNNGYIVSGSDAKESELTEKLRQSGIKVAIGHAPHNLDGAEIVINTAAVKCDNVEMIVAKERGIPIFERSVLLGTIMESYVYPIAIAGTHGKTTTTAMTSQILLDSGKDPSCLVGGQLSSIGGNIRVGSSDYLVCEACEYVDSFLSLRPKLAVVLNIEADHLDYFRDLEHIKESFKKFVNLAGSDGYVIVNGDDTNALDVVRNVAPRVVTFGIENEDCNFVAKNIRAGDASLICYDLYIDGNFAGKIDLFVPGRHNILNSLAAIACAKILDIDFTLMAKGLSNFKGTKRRFDHIGSVNGSTVVDDYAHHPTEITATLKAAKELNYKRIICIFQPHTYTRTIALFDDFATALSIADKVILTDVYAAREKNTTAFSCQSLADKVENCKYIKNFSDIISYVKDIVTEGDLVITMGAGDIYTVAYGLVK